MNPSSVQFEHRIVNTVTSVIPSMGDIVQVPPVGKEFISTIIDEIPKRVPV
jgi:hypothetical protein